MKRSSVALFGGAAILAACSSASTGSNPGGPASAGDAGGRALDPGSDSGIHVASALRAIQSCGDLTLALRDDARAKMNANVDAQIKSIRAQAAATPDGGVFYGGGGGFSGSSGSSSSGGPGLAVTTGPSPQAPTAAGGAATNATAPGPSTAVPAHSNTETQVKGVDEADIVKTDGQNIYVLHGNTFLVADAWPPTALGIASSLQLEGNPSEMYVEGTQAVVFSQVDGTAIYAAAGVTPKPPYSEGYGYGYGGGFGGGAVALPSGPNLPGGNYTSPLTKVTVLSLMGATPSVTRELYFEGGYLSSRRIDQTVRMILTGGGHGPTLLNYPQQPVVKTMTTPDGTLWTSSPGAEDYIKAWEAVRAENNRRIDATRYTD